MRTAVLPRCWTSVAVLLGEDCTAELLRALVSPAVQFGEGRTLPSQRVSGSCSVLLGKVSAA